jgi:hypothetical protein
MAPSWRWRWMARPVATSAGAPPTVPAAVPIRVAAAPVPDLQSRDGAVVGALSRTTRPRRRHGTPCSLQPVPWVRHCWCGQLCPIRAIPRRCGFRTSTNARQGPSRSHQIQRKSTSSATGAGEPGVGDSVRSRSRILVNANSRTDIGDQSLSRGSGRPPREVFG